MARGTFPDEVPQRYRIPTQALSSDYDVGRFFDVAGGAGVDTVGLSGGVVVEDFDGDGYLDIMASSFGLRDQVRFYRNRGDGRFDDGDVQLGPSRAFTDDDGQVVFGGLDHNIVGGTSQSLIVVYDLSGTGRSGQMPIRPHGLFSKASTLFSSKVMSCRRSRGVATRSQTGVLQS